MIAHQFPRHEPTAWLRRVAEAAALTIAANGPLPKGLRLIVPLVVSWPPGAPSDGCCCRCKRVGVIDSQRCGFEATSGHLPEVTLRFTFELCGSCATKEFGPGAADPLPTIDMERKIQHEQ